MLISSLIKNARNNSMFPSNVNARKFMRKSDWYSNFYGGMIENDKEIKKST